MANALKKIISGGQTGADQGALKAATFLGYETGGWMPKGFRTESGPRPKFKNIYGMSEHHSFDYRPRTELNVLSSNGTLIFGNANSPGCRLTNRLCNFHHKPIFHMFWKKEEIINNMDGEFFQSWLHTNKVEILNVAGNREEKNPGIEEACINFLMRALS